MTKCSTTPQLVNLLNCIIARCSGCAAMDIYTEILAMYERNYPETLSRTYVINGMLTIYSFTLLAVSKIYIINMAVYF